MKSSGIVGLRVRQEDEIGTRPHGRVERAMRGIFEVIDAARKLLRAQCCHQRFIIDHAMPAEIDQARALLHQADFGRTDQSEVVRRERHRDEHHICARQQSMQPVRRVHLADLWVGPCVPRRRQHRHAEALCQRCCTATGFSEADDKKGLTGDAGTEQLIPSVLTLLVRQRWDEVVDHQNRHEQRFADLRLMGALGIGQRDMRRQPIERQQVVDAGAGQLDPREFGGELCHMQVGKLPAQ